MDFIYEIPWLITCRELMNCQDSGTNPHRIFLLFSELTERGNANGAQWVFPFLYRGQFYYQCTTIDHFRRWCATTDNYDRDSRWGNCIGWS